MKRIWMIIIGIVTLMMASCADLAVVGSTDYLYTDYYVTYYSHPIPPCPYYRPVPPPRRPHVQPRRNDKPVVKPDRRPSNGSYPQGNRRGTFGGRR